jgi:group I intron endonuclease
MGNRLVGYTRLCPIKGYNYSMTIHSGVYEILNTINNHRYIGSSYNISARLNEHAWSLLQNRHHNAHLQSAFKKYGKDVFVFHPLLFCDVDNNLMYEQMCINGLIPEYNLALCTTAPMKGIKHSEEARLKISVAGIGRRHSEETKAKLRGRITSKETRAKLSAAATGRKVSGETRAKLSIANMGRTNSLGRKASEETRARISLNHADMSGKNNPYFGMRHSPEICAKMSAAHLGQTGERCGASILTWAQVNEIRSRYIPRKVSCLTLAKEYGVAAPTIFNVITNRTWKVT